MEKILATENINKSIPIMIVLGLLVVSCEGQIKANASQRATCTSSGSESKTASKSCSATNSKVDTTAPSPVGVLASADVTLSSISLSWPAASDDKSSAAGLKYLVCSSKSADAIATVEGCVGATIELPFAENTLKVSIKGKDPGTTYYFNVVVQDEAGNKAIYKSFSQKTLDDTTAPTPGAFSTTSSITSSGFTINWTAASDDSATAASLLYFVCSGANAAAIDSIVKCEASTSELAYTANKTSLVLTGKNVGTTYYYNVVVKDPSGNKAIYNGASASPFNDTTAPSAGSFGASSSVTGTSFTLNWSAATDDFSSSSDLVYMVCSGVNTAAIDTVAECEGATQEMAYTAATLTKAISGKTLSSTYYYNVVVKDLGGNKSIYNGVTQSTTADITVPTAGAFSASTSVSSSAFTLNWSAASDDVTATASLLYLVCSGANAAAIDTVAECEGATVEMAYTANTLTKAISGKSPSTTYYYNVVVKDAAGNKSIYNGQSQATTADTTVPTAGTFSASTSVTNTGFVLNWSAATDDVTAAASLQYFVCSGANAAAINSVANCEGSTAEMAYTANTTTYTITGKTSGTTYYYNVVVKDAAGNKSLYDGKTQATSASASDNWSSISATSEPTPLSNATSVWTGSKVIVWGGIDYSGSVYNIGGQYDPVADSWSSVTTTSAPSGRISHSMIWTGSKVIIWGGAPAAVTNTGGVYDPVLNSWTATTTTSAPVARSLHTAVWNGSKMIIWGGVDATSRVNTGGMYDPVANSWTATSTTSAAAARSAHGAVWTGSKMLVWGGGDAGGALNTGGVYDPASDTWASMTTTNAPTGRVVQRGSVVWTGSKMIIWGGQWSTTYYNTGGLYDPVADSWTTITTTSAPSARAGHTGVWTGGKYIVWGGENGSAVTATGAYYDPVTDSWTATTSTSAPSARRRHVSQWTGSKMIVWGGEDFASVIATAGGAYRLQTASTSNSWAATSTTSAPTARVGKMSIWTGSKMLVWGGVTTVSGSYDPVADSWSAITSTGAPTARTGHSVIWNGSKMIVWGGANGTEVNTGGIYDPVANSWTSTSTTSAPAARQGHVAVWTGGKMIVWGGTDTGTGVLNTGGVYDPFADTWTATTTTGAPSARSSHVAVWTGSKMIVWGGLDASSAVKTGGIYDPTTDSWTATTTTGAPPEAEGPVVAWTGSEMIVWGGYTEGVFMVGTSPVDTGGRYNPTTDSWTAITTTGAPAARYMHMGVWTGARLIVWGGYDDSVRLNSGAVYNPLTNAWSAMTNTSAPTTRNDGSAIWTGAAMIVWGGSVSSAPTTGGIYTP